MKKIEVEFDYGGNIPRTFDVTLMANFSLLFAVLQPRTFSRLLSRALPGTRLSSTSRSLSLILLRSILRHDLLKRPTARDLLHHAILQKNNNGRILQADDM